MTQQKILLVVSKVPHSSNQGRVACLVEHQQEGCSDRTLLTRHKVREELFLKDLEVVCQASSNNKEVLVHLLLELQRNKVKVQRLGEHQLLEVPLLSEVHQHLVGQRYLGEVLALGQAQVQVILVAECLVVAPHLVQVPLVVVCLVRILEMLQPLEV